LSFKLDFAPCRRAFDMSNKYYLYLLTYLPRYVVPKVHSLSVHRRKMF